MKLSCGRRSFLNLASFAAAGLVVARPAFADDLVCLLHTDEFVTESGDSPFFLHYHTVAIPVAALIALPADGVRVVTTPVDQGSYDLEGFNQFIEKSGLDPGSLKTHHHEILVSQNELARIAKGEANVEIRVISPGGNYVHNFLVTAPPSALVKVRKQLVKT